MSEECTHNCSTCSANCGHRDPASMLQTPHSSSNIKKVIAVVSGKGGVGKSIVTSMLATLTQRAGHQTAILDADITGPSIPKMFGIHGPVDGTDDGLFPVSTRFGTRVMSINLLLEEEDRPVVWRGPVIAGAVTQFWTDVIWNNVDYMFVDMPPGTGDVPLTVFQSIPVDGIIIVTSPQELVGMIVQKAVNMAKMMDIPIIGLIENMSGFVCPDCGRMHSIFGESHVDEIAAQYGLPVLAKIPFEPKIASLCDKGSIELFEGDWLNNAASAVEALPKKIWPKAEEKN